MRPSLSFYIIFLKNIFSVTLPGIGLGGVSERTVIQKRPLQLQQEQPSQQVLRQLEPQQQPQVIWSHVT